MRLTNRVELAVDEVMGSILPHLGFEVDKQALRKNIFENLDALASDVYGDGYNEGIDSERFWGRMITGDSEK